VWSHEGGGRWGHVLGLCDLTTPAPLEMVEIVLSAGEIERLSAGPLN